MRVADPPATLQIDRLNPTHDRKAFARGFYRQYGFVDLPDRPSRLYLPMTVVQKLKLG